MKLRQFLSVVPRTVRISASILVGCAVLTGLIVGFFERTIYHLPHDPMATFRGMGIGFLLGGLLAIWLIGLGYVYGDARRRAMRQPVLWVLVAILCPHLLGFLLYFVLRQPIAVTCTNCGQAIPSNQRFCFWCGNPQSPTPSGNGQSQPSSSRQDSIA
jgi:hypothetical protein